MRGIIVGLGLIALLGAGCDGGGGGQECTPEAASACEGGVTYWLDSCGERGEAIETCACGCDPGGLACLTECPCVPDCAGRECGPDGCGGTCGACGAQERCEAGWMFPRFLSDSITWAAGDAPAGIGGTLVADIQAALELAEEHDLYLMLTLFSFDSFYASADEAGIWSRSIQPMVLDPLKRQALLENLVTPVALAVEASPFKARMLAWDLINEPEWALHGPNPNGGEDFEPNGECEAVTHKPVVIGEYPIQGLSAVGGRPARTSAEYSADMWTWGYARPVRCQVFF